MLSLPSVPKGHRVYAIGDIHGCLDLLQRLMKKIKRNKDLHPETLATIVFLGDYIDRGPDSKGIIDYLLKNISSDFTPVFLRGNHEETMLRFLEGELDQGANWLPFGGLATLASYGVRAIQTDNEEQLASIQGAFVAKFPPEHRVFFAKMLLSYQIGDYFFAHAGVKPGVPLSQQEPEDLMWIRSKFLHSTDAFGKVVVHGHTISEKPAVRKNRIGIDTGAYASGILTCLVLEETKRGFLTA